MNFGKRDIKNPKIETTHFSTLPESWEGLSIYESLKISTELALNQSHEERSKYENCKTPAEILRYWFSSVHVIAKRKNIQPNIALVLTHTDLIASEYIKSYIKTIQDMIDGKPYAAYFSEENIILVNNFQDSFEDIRGKLFDRIKMQPSWGVERPIRWLGLEAELSNCSAYGGTPLFQTFISDKGEQYLGISEVKKFASEFDMDDYEVESFLEFHHVLGDLICCPPSELGNFIITDPKWLLDEFNLAYSFMSRQRKKGIICSRVLKKHWRDNAQFLTDLMINIVQGYTRRQRIQPDTSKARLL